MIDPEHGARRVQDVTPVGLGDDSFVLYHRARIARTHQPFPFHTGGCPACFREGVMITFNVSREAHGWAVRPGEGAMTPYWSRELAITRAEALATAMRRHGQDAIVVVAADLGEESASFAPRPTAVATTSFGTA